MALSKIDLEMLNHSFNMETLTKSLSSLEVDTVYKILQISILNTRFGKAVLVKIYDDKENAIFKVWLPKRAVEQITEDVTEKMNRSDIKYGLIYLGQSAPTFNGGKPKCLFKFAIVE